MVLGEEGIIVNKNWDYRSDIGMIPPSWGTMVQPFCNEVVQTEAMKELVERTLKATHEKQLKFDLKPPPQQQPPQQPRQSSQHSITIAHDSIAESSGSLDKTRYCFTTPQQPLIGR